MKSLLSGWKLDRVYGYDGQLGPKETLIYPLLVVQYALDLEHNGPGIVPTNSWK